MRANGMTLNGLLELAATSADGGLRILDRREHSRWLSWSEVRERARSVAGRLLEGGILPGQRVALIYPTSAGFFDAFFGALLAGAVPVPLYPPVRLGRLDEYHGQTAAMLRAVDREAGSPAPRSGNRGGAPCARMPNHRRSSAGRTELDGGGGG